jgi:hypothetical protein
MLFMLYALTPHFDWLLIERGGIASSHRVVARQLWWTR